MSTESQPKPKKEKRVLTLPGAAVSEATLLGLIFVLEDGMAHYVCSKLEPDDFIDQKCRIIFHAVTKLVRNHQPVNANTIVETMTKAEIDFVTMNFVFDLATRVVYADEGAVDFHCKKIKDSAVARKIILLCRNVADHFDDMCQENDWDSFSSEVRSKINKIAESSTLSQMKTAKEVAESTMEEILATKEAAKSNGLIGVDTGLSGLNDLTHGLRKGQLVVIAGKTSMGKSAFAINMAISAVKAGHKVAFYSLEMNNESQMKRILSNLTEINGDSIISGKVSQDGIQKLEAKAKDVHSVPMFFCDKLNIYEDIEASIINLKAREEDLETVFIDYIQLMFSKQRGLERHYEIGYMTTTLKRLAERLGISIVILSQLKRDDSEDPPTVSDLKDSASLENDANLIIFVHRPDYFFKDKSKVNPKFSLTQIIVAKNREGKTGVVETVFYRSTSKFYMKDQFGDQCSQKQKQPNEEGDDPDA